MDLISDSDEDVNDRLSDSFVIRHEVNTTGLQPFELCNHAPNHQVLCRHVQYDARPAFGRQQQKKHMIIIIITILLLIYYYHFISFHFRFGMDVRGHLTLIATIYHLTSCIGLRP
jgi:hypothetical protein